MLFMNSGGKSQGWFHDVLGDGRVEQRLFTLPTGNFSMRSTAFYSMIFGNYFRTVLVFVTMVFYR